MPLDPSPNRVGICNSWIQHQRSFHRFSSLAVAFHWGEVAPRRQLDTSIAETSPCRGKAGIQFGCLLKVTHGLHPIFGGLSLHEKSSLHVGVVGLSACSSSGGALLLPSEHYPQ